jgi:hypothetical protein
VPRSDPRGGRTDALLGTVTSFGAELLIDVLAEAPVGMGYYKT